MGWDNSICSSYRNVIYPLTHVICLKQRSSLSLNLFVTVFTPCMSNVPLFWAKWWLTPQGVQPSVMLKGEYLCSQYVMVHWVFPYPQIEEVVNALKQTLPAALQRNLWNYSSFHNKVSAQHPYIRIWVQAGMGVRGNLVQASNGIRNRHLTEMGTNCTRAVDSCCEC